MEPIHFQKEKEQRETAVKQRLMKIRTAEENYKRVARNLHLDFATLIKGNGSTGKCSTFPSLTTRDSRSGNHHRDQERQHIPLMECGATYEEYSGWPQRRCHTAGDRQCQHGRKVPRTKNWRHHNKQRQCRQLVTTTQRSFPQHGSLSVPGKNSLSFSVAEGERQVTYEPYAMKSGVSMAANLRQAFKESELLLRGYRKARLFIDTPVLLVPVVRIRRETERYFLSVQLRGARERHHHAHSTASAQRRGALPSQQRLENGDGGQLCRRALHSCAATRMGTDLHQRSFVGIQKKLFADLHDGKLDIFCFERPLQSLQNPMPPHMPRTLIVPHPDMYGNCSGHGPEEDELHVVGDVPDKDWFIHNTKLYIQKTYLLNLLPNSTRYSAYRNQEQYLSTCRRSTSARGKSSPEGWPHSNLHQPTSHSTKKCAS